MGNEFIKISIISEGLVNYYHLVKSKEFEFSCNSCSLFRTKYHRSCIGRVNNMKSLYDLREYCSNYTSYNELNLFSVIKSNLYLK